MNVPFSSVQGYRVNMSDLYSLWLCSSQHDVNQGVPWWLGQCVPDSWGSTAFRMGEPGEVTLPPPPPPQFPGFKMGVITVPAFWELQWLLSIKKWPHVLYTVRIQMLLLTFLPPGSDKSSEGIKFNPFKQQVWVGRKPIIIPETMKRIFFRSMWILSFLCGDRRTWRRLYSHG